CATALFGWSQLPVCCKTSYCPMKAHHPVPSCHAVKTAQHPLCIRSCESEQQTISLSDAALLPEPPVLQARVAEEYLSAVAPLKFSSTLQVSVPPPRS